jgi:hypothetical protein
LTGLQATFTDAAADADDDGDVTVDLSSSSAALVNGVLAALVFEGQTGCAPASSWTDLAFDGEPVLKIAGDLARPSTNSDGILVVVEADSRGDCNSDNVVNAGDFSATALEIFDTESSNTDSRHVHKDSWLYSPKSAFAGSAKGCDSNNDKRVLVSDIVCTARLFFGYSCDSTVVSAAAGLPVVAAPSASLASSGMTVDVPVEFSTNGHAIASMAFTLSFDPSQLSFDALDNNSDGLPDAITFNAPQEVYRLAVYDAVHGRLQILLTGIALPLPLLTDGTVVTVQLTGVAGVATQPASLTLSDVSLGSDEGQTAPVEVVYTGSRLGNNLFIPLVSSRQ